MPSCRVHRWHATPEEANACLKHLHDKDFDNLSTISRTRERTQSPSSSSSSSLSSVPASRSTRPRRARTPSQSPAPTHTPIPGSQSLPAMSQQGDEGVRATQSDPGHGQSVPLRALSGGTPGADPVDVWARQVAENTPGTVPVDNIDDRPGTPGPRQPPYGPGTVPVDIIHHRPASPAPGQPPDVPATPPGGQRPNRRQDKGAEIDAGDTQNEQTPSKPPAGEEVMLAAPERRWYQSENFRIARQLTIIAIFSCLILGMLALWLGSRDADRFP